MIIVSVSFGQQKVKDGTVTGSSILPNSAAILELESNNKGLLYPRVSLQDSTTKWTLTGSAIAGMVVYNTNTSLISTNSNYPILPAVIGLYYWDGAGWSAMKFSSTSNDWHITGNAGTNSGSNFLGTTDNASLKFRVNNQTAGFLDSSTALTIANGNVFYGLQAGFKNPRLLTYNTYIGSAAGYYTLPTSATNPNDGFKNVAVGTQAMFQNTTGQQNVAIGYQASSGNTTGLGNTAIGSQAMTTGSSSNNTAIGWHALNSNSGNTNVAVGYDAMGANQQGSGAPNGSVTFTNVGTSNVAVGPKSLRGNVNGSNNVAMGYQAMLENTVSGGGSGNDNIAIGTNALSTVSNGSYNVSIGSSAGFSNTSGSSNVELGFNAGVNTVAASNNTFVGYQAGYNNNTGGNNTTLGYKADVTTSALSNATAIGYNSKVAQSSSLILGGTGTDAVNVGIGTAAPNSTLQMLGSLSLSIKSITSDYLLGSSDYKILVRSTGTADINISLPDPTTCIGRTYVIQNMNASGGGVKFNYNIETGSGSVINSGTQTCIQSFTTGSGYNAGNSITLQSDGTVWTGITQ